jgi:hypothetical protein
LLTGDDQKKNIVPAPSAISINPDDSENLNDLMPERDESPETTNNCTITIVFVFTTPAGGRNTKITVIPYSCRILQLVAVNFTQALNTGKRD